MGIHIQMYIYAHACTHMRIEADRQTDIAPRCTKRLPFIQAFQVVAKEVASTQHGEKCNSRGKSQTINTTYSGAPPITQN